MSDPQQYKTLMSEIVAKQIVLLGPAVAISKARNVEDIVVSEEGEVIEINGDLENTLRKLINQYVELSGQIVKNALGLMLEKYPTINNPAK
jgi:glycine cleavage system H lipoate-binding protein